MKLVLTGHPKTGKTTLADRIGAKNGWPVFHTDDTVEMDWSEASEEVAKWFDKKGDWVIEGVTAVRAIRKWFEKHPDADRFPADMVVFTREQVVPWENKGTFTKGIDTVWHQVYDRVATDTLAAARDLA